MNAQPETLPASDVFNINNYEQMIAFRDATNSGENFNGIRVELNCDIDLKESWVPASNYWRKDDTKQYWFRGTFDGNNHVISSLSNENLSISELRSGHNSSSHADAEYSYGLFATSYNANFYDITFKKVNIVATKTDTGISNESVAALVGFCYGDVDHTTIIDGIKVYGNISAVDVVASVVGTARNNVHISNCYSEATITSNNRGAGIVCTITTQTQDHNFNAIVESCEFAGGIKGLNTIDSITSHTTTAAGIFTYNDANKIRISVKDLKARPSCISAGSNYKYGNIYQHQQYSDITCSENISSDDYIVIAEGGE